MSLKPLKVFGHWGGPNPWKVGIILKELNIPHDWEVVEFSDVKNESYLKINPNGRLPAIQDPNTGIALWETGAIIEYLIDEYDKENKISYSTRAEKYLTLQWLMFQVSGQGPYYGQAAWFLRFHPEKIQSAIDRYVNEIERVTGVLNGALKDKQWLIGDKCTYADLSFVTWAEIGKGVLAQSGKLDVLEKYPNYQRWMAAMTSRPVVREVLDHILAERKAHGLPP